MTDNKTLAILIVLGLIAAALVRLIWREYAGLRLHADIMERQHDVLRALAARGGK